MHRAERAIRDAIADGRIPGAVLLVGNADGVLYRKAFGHRRIRPARQAMTVDTVFDVASLTKVIATSTAIVHLVDSGKLKLTDKVAAHLPAFAAGGKSDVTVEQLLLHRSGLAPANALSQYDAGADKAIQRICAAKPRHAPGSRYVYSDLGYIVLGELVREVAGKGLDAYAAEHVFGPLKMTHTRFNPPAAWTGRIAPTDTSGSARAIGRVHDPRAAALGGVAGHAGLFSTADDLGRWCRMLLNSGQLDAARVLGPAAVDLMLEPRRLEDGKTFTRSLALNRFTVHDSRPHRTRSHTGFTGTLIWIDPVRRCFLVLLTNRTHLGLAKTAPLRHAVIAAVDEAARLARDDSSPVLTGVDMLVRDNFRAIRNRRVGLITNHTGRDRFGRRTVDLIHNAPDVTLVALFSPEHGLAGLLDQPNIAHDVDKTTALPVHSLYGRTRRPTAEMLEGIDTLVFDIQDVGTRYYTYIATMGYAMEAAAEHKVSFVVLDRPNPIAPLGPAGPSADPDRLAFTSYQAIPLAHGLTIGELARLFKHAFGVKCELHVVPMTGWKRSMWWDDTGLTWTNPSPNMRNPTQAVLYPAVGQLEASNLSVGRGTDQPFELFGAPWIDPSLGGHRTLAAVLNAAALPGLRFVPIVFTPAASKHKDKRCGGVFILVTDRRQVKPVEAGLAIAWHLKGLFGQAFDHDAVLRMVRNAKTQQAWTQANSPTTVGRVWAGSLEEFQRKTAPHMLYR